MTTNADYPATVTVEWPGSKTAAEACKWAMTTGLVPVETFKASIAQMQREITSTAQLAEDYRAEIARLALPAEEGQALREEVARLTEYRKASDRTHQYICGHAEDLAAEVDKLRAEIARLTAAAASARQTVEEWKRVAESAEETAGQYERDEQQGRINAFGEVLALLEGNSK